MPLLTAIADGTLKLSESLTKEPEPHAERLLSPKSRDAETIQRLPENNTELQIP